LADYKKILVVRLSSLGDVLLATPLLKEIKRVYPNVEIDFLVKPQFIEAVQTNENLNSVYELAQNKNNKVLIQTLNKNKYDFVIDLQNNFRSRSLTSKLGVKCLRFKKPTLKKFLLVQFKWNFYKEIKSIPQMYFETVSELSFNNQQPEINISDNIVPSVKPGDKFIGFAPGAKHFTKMYPLEYFIELGRMFNEEDYTVLLFGGKADKDICHKIHSSLPNSIDLSTDDNLLQLAADMKECKIVICNDSGLMHTAVAAGTTVAAIFGSTVKEFGFFPYSNNSLIIENDGLKCRPCSHIGKSKCPKKHFKCMLELTPDIVYKEIKEFMYSL